MYSPLIPELRRLGQLGRRIGDRDTYLPLPTRCRRASELSLVGHSLWSPGWLVHKPLALMWQGNHLLDRHLVEGRCLCSTERAILLHCRIVYGGSHQYSRATTISYPFIAVVTVRVTWHYVIIWQIACMNSPHISKG